MSQTTTGQLREILDKLKDQVLPERLYDEHYTNKIDGYFNGATDRLTALLAAERLDELEQRVSRLQSLLKTNSDVSTGDMGGFNVGINASLRADDDRIKQLKKQAEA